MTYVPHAEQKLNAQGVMLAPKPLDELVMGDYVFRQVATSERHPLMLAKVAKRTPKRIHVNGTEYGLDGFKVVQPIWGKRLVPLTHQSLMEWREQQRVADLKDAVAERKATAYEQAKEREFRKVVRMIRGAVGDDTGLKILQSEINRLANL